MCQGLRYDVDHECRRKQQLSLLYGRTRDEVDEEERLITELNRIESRRRDRERKKQDLQKLISQVDSPRELSTLIPFCVHTACSNKLTTTGLEKKHNMIFNARFAC